MWGLLIMVDYIVKMKSIEPELGQVDACGHP